MKNRVLLLATCLLASLLLATASGFAQELQSDPAYLAPKALESAQPPKVLQGGVSTLESAIEEERGLVDWYAWYLEAREYLKATGGLNCPLGTMIRFSKNGQVEAYSQFPTCRISAASKFFPLPAGTNLEAILLPVRSGASLPAPAEELMKRIPGEDN